MRGDAEGDEVWESGLREIKAFHGGRSEFRD